MVRRNYSIKTIIRLDRIKNDVAPLYLRILMNRQKMEYFLGYSVPINSWDTQTQKVIKYTLSKIINNHIDAEKSFIRNLIVDIINQEKTFSIDSLKKILGKNEEQGTLRNLIKLHNEHFISMVGTRYSSGSYKNYKTTEKFIIEFIKYYFKRSDIPLDEVNNRFVDVYLQWLISKKGTNNNGCVKHLQRLKKVMNYAERCGMIERNPIGSYSMSIKPAVRNALTNEEVQKLINTTLENETLNRIRDIFVFQIYTGISYADVKKLCLEDFVNEQDGSVWLKMNRTKTRTSFMLPLLQPALDILNKYHIREPGKKEPIFKVISNQKMNVYLKAIQKLAGIEKKLHVHLARHTFATTITLSNGVPIETVSRMLGHTSIRTTQIYAKVNQRKIADDMAVVVKKLKDPI